MKFDFRKTVEKLTDIPKDFRGLYTEEDGKHVLRKDDPGVASAVSAIQGMQDALVKERGLTTDLKAKQVDLTGLSTYGSTVEEISEGITTAIADASKGKKSPEETATAVRAAQDALKETHTKDIEKLTGRNQLLTGQLNKLLVTGEAMSALATHGAIKPELVMPFIEQSVQVVEEDGTFSAQVLDKDGKTPRYSGTGTGPMTISEFVGEMKEQEDMGSFFKSDKNSGGGTPPTNGRPGPGPGGKENLSPTQKIAQGLANR